MAPMMTPVMMIGTTQLIIILVIVVVLFGGAKLAGLGKSMGSAIKEFKNETKGLAGGDDSEQHAEVVDAEIVEPQDQQQSPPPQMNRSSDAGGSAPQSSGQQGERAASEAGQPGSQSS